MAVYTPVDAASVAAFVAGYDLGAYRDHQGITQGVENTNYHLYTDCTRAILTIFEKRTNPADLPFVFGLTAHLGAADIPVPDTYADRNGAIVGTLAGKPAAITRFLDGTGMCDADITPDSCAQLGAMLARMHVAAQSYTPVRANPVGPVQWHDLLSRVAPLTPLMDGHMRTHIDEVLHDYRALEKTGLPQGAIHADVFPDNVFFKDGSLTGVIDFYFACTGFYAYDLTMTLNAWCFTHSGQPLHDRIDAFMAAYQAVRPLRADERAALEPLRRAAALRIFATRLYDWVFTPAGADVVKKDPREYAAKMKATCPWRC